MGGLRPRAAGGVRGAHGRGFTYLLMLFALAAGGAAMGLLASAWTTAAERQLERESRHRGQEIADAMGRWRAVVLAPEAGTAAAGPQTLEELVKDRRTPTLQRHLRRVWEDPLTGRADWVLLRDARGAITALHSRASRPARLSHDLEPREDGQPPRVSDRVFRPREMTATHAVASEAASAPATSSRPATPTRGAPK
ncbi:General secretion pathway protein [Rubrivivax sp. A210]|uniref:hypothetical protein n=1 Tax=Rubrivivax sp. A210 TaxID=2772301 RepID=UPI00191A0B74|nr:hypothetical protein [Rubrivivax sp. A210]CAD5373518.1 General secretion pathway protein [Rubrivivax sp. A210]